MGHHLLKKFVIANIMQDLEMRKESLQAKLQKQVLLLPDPLSCKCVALGSVNLIEVLGLIGIILFKRKTYYLRIYFNIYKTVLISPSSAHIPILA